MITANPVHWHVAANALIRAMVFDELEVSQPRVSALADVLVPIAKAELGYGKAVRAWRLRNAYQQADARPEQQASGRPEFPVLDGPVFILGLALADATSALVGDDPPSEVLTVLSSGIGSTIPGVEGRVVAEALIGALAAKYRHHLRGGTEGSGRSGSSPDGNPLEAIIAAGHAAPEDVLRIGLAVLSVLAELCKSDSPSIIRRVA